MWITDDEVCSCSIVDKKIGKGSRGDLKQMGLCCAKTKILEEDILYSITHRRLIQNGRHGALVYNGQKIAIF
jgi:hypothetical protein